MLFIAPRASISTCSTPGDVGHLSQLRGGFLGHFMSSHTPKHLRKNNVPQTKTKKTGWFTAKIPHSNPSNFRFFVSIVSCPCISSLSLALVLQTLKAFCTDSIRWAWSTWSSVEFVPDSKVHPKNERIKKGFIPLGPWKRAESDTMIAGYIWFSKKWVWKKFAIPLAIQTRKWCI